MAALPNFTGPAPTTQGIEQTHVATSLADDSARVARMPEVVTRWRVLPRPTGANSE